MSRVKDGLVDVGEELKGKVGKGNKGFPFTDQFHILLSVSWSLSHTSQILPLPLGLL